MSFTYVLTNDIGKVRLEIGDQVLDGALFTDEEITAIITAVGGTSVLLWAARAADILARRFARDFNWTADGTRVELGNRAKHYADLAAQLRTDASIAVGGTGINVLHTIHADGWNAGRDVDESMVGRSAFSGLLPGDTD